MRIWLLTIGEPLPIDEGNVRLLRTGILANILVGQGHEVVWWSSTFDHAKKKHRSLTDRTLKIQDSLTLRLLHSTGYKSNISIARVLNHYGIARKFSQYAQSEIKPDIILSSLPTLELCVAAVRYGRKHLVPVVLDVRDLWPDIFLELCPKWGRKLATWLLYPMYYMARFACQGAAAIMANAPASIKWGLDYAKRESNQFDQYFPFGYIAEQPTARELHNARLFWAAHGVSADDQAFILCFFGNMGRYFEIEMLIEAAKLLSVSGRPIKIVLCGTGENLSKYQSLATGCENIVFSGLINASQIWILMRMSSIGLAPYRSDIGGFLNALPNKIIEYWSAGLPIVSSLQGYVSGLLEAKQCGLTYQNGNLYELVEKIINLYDDREKLKQMSSNAYRFYQEEFVAEKVYQNMAEHLSRIVIDFKKLN